MNIYDLWNASLAHTTTSRNSYKFLWAFYLLEHCDKSNSPLEINYGVVNRFFFEKLWDLRSLLALDDSINPKEKSEYIQIVERELKKHKVLEGIPLKEVLKNKDLKSKIDKDMFENFSKRNETLNNPISRFIRCDQRIDIKKSGDNVIIGENSLYTWDSKEGIVNLRKETPKLFKDANIDILKKLLLNSYVSFLSRINPHRNVHNPVHSLFSPEERTTIKSKTREIALTFKGGHCFYCNDLTIKGVSKSDPKRREFDHFIPESYISDSSLWNIVVSCGSCNSGTGGKFKRLGSKLKLQELLERNLKFYQEGHISSKDFPDHNYLEDQTKRLYQKAKQAGIKVWENY